jgi:hypothetical protein
MSDGDALVGDMHPPLGFPEAASPAADQDTLERLLDGRLDPTTAPNGYGGLARLVAAVTAPATPEELAGKQVVLAEFAAVMQSRPPTPISRRAAMPSKLFRVKAAAAALVAMLSIGGVAAATGLLPGRAQPAADHAPSTSGAGTTGHGLGQATAADLDKAAAQGLCRAWQAGQGADSGRRADSPAFQALAVAAGGGEKVAAYCANAVGGSDDGQGQTSAVGPDAMAAARAGLCQAWQAGQGGDTGRREDSVAFQALAAAAGGAGKIAGFCQATTAGSAGTPGQGQDSPASGAPASTRVSPPSSVPSPTPSTGSGGHGGQGGPPTTTG